MTLIRTLPWIGAAAFCSLIVLAYLAIQTSYISALGWLWCISPILLASAMHSRLAQKRLFWMIVVGFWTTTFVWFFYIRVHDIDAASGKLIEWRGYYGIYQALARDLEKPFTQNDGITLLIGIIGLLAPLMTALVFVHLSMMICRGRKSRTEAT
jgi:hypothetical protein